MLNKVFLEGIVTNCKWGSEENSGFFVSIKQERNMGNWKRSSYFSLYANRPLANVLADRIAKEPNALIKIEGSLKNYQAKNGEWKTTVCIEKIVDDEVSPVVERTRKMESIQTNE